jgi:hypothetical protein
MAFFQSTHSMKLGRVCYLVAVGPVLVLGPVGGARESLRWKDGGCVSLERGGG